MNRGNTSGCLNSEIMKMKTYRIKNPVSFLYFNRGKL